MLQEKKHTAHIQIYHNNMLVFDQQYTQFPITIGRNPSCDVALPNYQWVSSMHANIIPIAGKLCLMDTESTGGILHNNQKVRNLPLKESNTVFIGSLKILIRADINMVDKEEFTDPNINNTLLEDETKSINLFDKKSPVNGNGLRHNGAGSDETTFITQHALIQKVSSNKTALEGRLMWKDTVLDTQVFHKGEVLSLSAFPDSGFRIPNLSHDMHLAQFDGHNTVCRLPLNSRGKVTNLSNKQETDIHRAGKTNTRKNKISFKLKKNEACSLLIDANLKLEFQHIDAPAHFSQIKFLVPEKLFQKTLQGSGFLHVMALILALVLAPTLDAPKVKNLPPRIAKLLIPKKKKLEVKPKKKPPIEKKKKIAKKKPKKKIKKIAKKKPKKKIKKIAKKKVKKKIKKVVIKKPIIKPKKIIVRKTKKMKKLNKWPFTVKTKTIAKKPFRAKNIKTVGALAALGALGAATPNPKNKAVAININKNAGGNPGKMKANSVLGALKAKGGKLVAGGSGSLKTFGKGFGTGSGYGVQGIKGRAGGRGRGVAATVVGTPSLMKISRREGLTSKQVMDVVRKNAGKVSSCYERALLNNPGLSGRIEYEWKIKASGKVTWAKVKKSNVQSSSELNNCVVKIFKKMRFPRATNGESTQPNIGFPFGRF